MPRKIEDEIGAEIVASDAKWAGRSAEYLARVRYDLRRKFFGLCLWPGCEVRVKPRRYCDEHRARRNAWQRANYAKRKTKPVA